MKQPRVASRYAKSILTLAIEKDCLAATLADMELVLRIGKESADLRYLLASPIVKADKKQAVLKAIFDGKLGELSNAFIQLLTAKRRETLLLEIADAFIAQYRTFKNIRTAEVRSAVKLDEGVRKEILAKITQDANSVELTEIIDPELIGGFVVRVGDLQIDTSVANSIRDLKKIFKSNSYIAEV
jgi:F-type H+-transporting ATPase subunit delta